MTNNFGSIPCHRLRGVGPKITALLAKCGVQTLEDLLLHLPLRYEDRTQITPIDQLSFGKPALVHGTLCTLLTPRNPRGRPFCCRVEDETGSIDLRFFSLHPKQQALFTVGRRLLCFGTPRISGRSRFTWEMAHPEIQWLHANEKMTLPTHFTAIYPTTQGLSQTTWRRLITQTFTLASTQPRATTDEVPSTFFTDYLTTFLQKIGGESLPDSWHALRFLHQPPVDAPLNQLLNKTHPAQRRLILEELLAHALSVQQRKQARRQECATALPPNRGLIERLMQALPFQLTSAQQRALEEISADMQQPYPMQRLLQGDVGSGKTIVAALVALQAIENGFQVGLMAPTELLSEQHRHHFCTWFEPLGLKVVNLTGKMRVKARSAALQAIESGEAAMVIGTHALFQETVRFEKLGLIIIDEQHRFGVQQRLALWEKGLQATQQAHQLFMTATPIPRTLAMTTMTGLDLSFIDEMPPGRLPIKTVVLSAGRRGEVIERIRQLGLQKKQVYWVCPLIEESELLSLEAATTLFQTLQACLPELQLGLIHGRLSAQEKETIMQQFKSGQFDLLVATSVIEVGIDVPNAQVMVIENAERLGLAQLHQLRGRVGRGDEQSYCILLYQNLSPIAQQRLAIMQQSQEGLVIAQRDLTLRGPGEVFGFRQTGWLPLRIADFTRDQYLLPKVLPLAQYIMDQAPYLIKPLIERWLKTTAETCRKT